MELLVTHRAPPHVAHSGRLTGYGGYWGNKVPMVDQNQHHYLVETGDLQRLEERNPDRKLACSEASMLTLSLGSGAVDQ